MEKKKGICKISFSGDFPDKKNIDIEFYKHKGLLKFNDFDKCTILQNMIDVLTEVQESYKIMSIKGYKLPKNIDFQPRLQTLFPNIKAP